MTNQFKPKEVPSSQQMKILVSGHLPPPMGGMATYYETLLKSSICEQVNLIFVQTSSHTRKFEKGGKFTLSNIFLSIADCWRFSSMLIKHRPQVAHIGTAFGLSFIKHSICVIVARIFRVKVLLHPHCSLASLYFEKSKLWKKLFLIIIKLTHGVIALSEEWFQLKTILPGVNIFYLPNAINLAEYEILIKLRTKRKKDDPLHILYLGHLGKEKGSYDIIEAIKLGKFNLRQAEVRLCGSELSPGEKDSLNSMIDVSLLSGIVKIHDPVMGPEKLEAYRWADVFVYPSYGEGMPMAILEAMGSGLPVVATKVGGIPDLITSGEHGILIKAGHPEEIIESVSLLAQNPETCRIMGDNAHERIAKNFDFEKRVPELMKIYSSIVT